MGSIPRRALKRIVCYLWNRAGSYRYLLGIDPNTLSPELRIKRAVLSFFLALPDIYYRYSFWRFGRLLTSSQRPLAVERKGLVFVIGTLGPGGAERQAVLTLAGLYHRGYSPLKMVCYSLHHEWQRFFLPHLECVHIPVSELNQEESLNDDTHRNPCKEIFDILQNLPVSLNGVRNYIQMVHDARPQLVHLWLDECNIKGGMAGVALGVPRIVLGLRSLPPSNFMLHQPYMREGYRWLARQSNVVLINNSHAGARAYENWLGLEEGHIRVVHNGFDFRPPVLARYRAGRIAYRGSHGLQEHALVVGTVIRLSEEKRPLLWLQIAAAVHRCMPGVRFLVIGDGPLRPELESFVAKEYLQDVVIMTGHQKQPLAGIAAMDLFLLTSRAEGLPNVLIEAQALGVPVVTCKVGGAPEVVEHGVTGWVLERDDVHSAADRLISLLQDKTWRATAGDKAPIFIEEHFGVERMLDETLAVYGGNLN